MKKVLYFILTAVIVLATGFMVQKWIASDDNNIKDEDITETASGENSAESSTENSAESSTENSVED